MVYHMEKIKAEQIFYIPEKPANKFYVITDNAKAYRVELCEQKRDRIPGFLPRDEIVIKIVECTIEEAGAFAGANFITANGIDFQTGYMKRDEFLSKYDQYFDKNLVFKVPDSEGTPCEWAIFKLKMQDGEKSFTGSFVDEYGEFIEETKISEADNFVVKPQYIDNLYTTENITRCITRISALSDYYKLDVNCFLLVRLNYVKGVTFAHIFDYNRGVDPAE